MALSIAQSISQPIKELSKGAGIIGSGNLDYKFATNTKDEVGQLARVFDKMVQDVKSLGFACDTERQRLYSVLETLPVYVVLLSEDYHVPFANKFFRERFGESGGKRCYEYLFMRSEPCENCESYKVMKTNGPHHWEWTGPDNRNYDIYDFPFIDTDGSRMILEMGIDVTEQKRAQESLREASQYARNLIETSLDPLVTISSDGKITDVNEATIRASGLARQELIGTDFANYFTDSEKAQAGYQQVFEKGFVTDYPLTIRHKDGRLMDVLYNASVYKDSRDNVLGVFAAARDVTGQKQAEAELRRHRDNLEALVKERTARLSESEEELKRAQAVGIIGNWRLNIQRNELIWSDENYRIFGVPKGEPLTYEAFLSLVHPDDRDCVDKRWKAAMAGDEYDIEHRIIAGGKVKWVREKAFIEFDQQGVLLAGFGITQDITTRRLMEEELRNSRDELEIRVQERTSELKEAVEALQEEMDERKQAEEKLKDTNALLSLFSLKRTRKDYLDAVVDLIHSWSGCQYIGIRILDDKGFIPYESYVGFSREFWESENRLSIEHAQCVCMRVVTGNPDPHEASMMTPGGSFHCDDTFAFVGRLSAEGKGRFRGVCIKNGFLSLTVVPIRYGNKVLGTIHLSDKERKRLSLSFIEFLEAMSPLIGEAINRFNLEDELRASESRLQLLSSQLLSVQEDERKRISAELHDDIAAKLSAIKFSLEKNLISVDKADRGDSESTKSIISMVIDTISSTRRIMINLRPAMIDDLGILATLNWYCREFEQIFTGIQIKKQINIEEIEIPDHLKIVIFRIVQEGMNNVAKHSGANHVALTLEKINDILALSIEDNGWGFDVENKTLESETLQGFGMVNMEERARFSGGNFSINSLKEKGTFLKVTWPLKPVEMIYKLRIEPS